MKGTPKISAEQFEREYASRSGISVETLRGVGRVVAHCYCDEPECEGWRSVSRTYAEEDNLEIVDI